MHRETSGILFVIFIIIIIVVIALFCNNKKSPFSRNELFAAVLNGSQEVPPIRTNGTGTARLTGTDRKLRYRIVFENLSSSLVSVPGHAHIHRGRRGENGPVVKTLNVGTRSNGRYEITGTWSSSDQEQPLTGELYRELQNGRLYVNIHTTRHPDGEIRGQLTHTRS